MSWVCVRKKWGEKENARRGLWAGAGVFVSSNSYARTGPPVQRQQQFADALFMTEQYPGVLVAATFYFLMRLTSRHHRSDHEGSHPHHSGTHKTVPRGSPQRLPEDRRMGPRSRASRPLLWPRQAQSKG